MPVNYILLGMPGSGKSSVGELLAKQLGYSFVDTDNLIETQLNGQSISEIFATKGEKYFREIETSVLKSLTGVTNHVISIGGGAYQKQENRKILNRIGKTIYLFATPQAIYERVKTSTERPLLNCNNPLLKLEQLFNERHNAYEQSDYTIDTTNLNQYNVINEILRRINGTSSGN